MAAGLFLASCSSGGEAFVKVEGSQFVLEGEPYYFLGSNFWHGAYLAADLVSGDRLRLERELDQLQAHRITNLRVMASTELSGLLMSVKPAFRNKEDYNEELLVGLDILLDEMARREMKAVLVLNNYWQWSGGMAQYLNWTTGNPVKDPDLSGDWRGFMFQSAGFYEDEAANELYGEYIRSLVKRRNTVSGIIYRDDPTIMAWQLANEPRPAPDAAENVAHAEAFVEWVHETAAFIQSLDGNHLVSTGNEGLAGSVQSREIFMDAHSCADIDYLTFHIWPKNWSWFDAAKPDSSFGPTMEKTFDYFGKHVAFARELDKPLVLEEFGMERDGGSFDPESPTTWRDRFLSSLFSAVVDSAMAGSPMAGLNFWAWGGEGKAMHPDYFWRQGDSFMGDPPQEAQGLNSVFSTDRSTLEVFEKYNRELDQLFQ